MKTEFRFTRWRFETKRLILLMVVMTTVGAVLLPSVLPHPTSSWSLFFFVKVPSYKVLNNRTQIIEPLLSNDSKQFAEDLVYPLNTSADHVMSTSPEEMVSFNLTRSNTKVAHITFSKDSCRPSDVIEYSPNKNNSIAKKCHVPETIAFVTEGSRLSNSLANSSREDTNEKNSTCKTSRIPKVEKGTPQATVSSEGGHTAHAKEVGRSTPELSLVYAKHEIRNALPVTDDPNLHPPVFLNVSMFRRPVPIPKFF